jgi:hypothetical protein
MAARVWLRASAISQEKNHLNLDDLGYFPDLNKTNESFRKSERAKKSVSFQKSLNFSTQIGVVRCFGFSPQEFIGGLWLILKISRIPSWPPKDLLAVGKTIFGPTLGVEGVCESVCGIDIGGGGGRRFFYGWCVRCVTPTAPNTFSEKRMTPLRNVFEEEAGGVCVRVIYLCNSSTLGTASPQTV